MPLVKYACAPCGTWQPWFSHAHTRSLFSGDTLEVERDERGRAVALSCHEGFLIPFEFARGVTRAHALALFDRLLAGMPHTRPIALKELS